MHELQHWPSIAGIFPQSHCGDDEDGHIGLYTYLPTYLPTYLHGCMHT